MSTRNRFPLPPVVVALILACATFSFPCEAVAQALDEDDPPSVAPRLERLDVAPHDLWTAPAPAAPPLWVGLQASFTRLAGGERVFGGMLLAGIPLERLAPPPASPPGAGRFSDGAAPRLKPPPRARRRAAPPPGAPPPAPEAPEAPAPAAPEAPAPGATGEAPATLPIPVRVTPEAARGAVRAALQRAHLSDAERRADGLASRARASALLPELRLRVSRLVDEAQTLSPTEYDPGRTTASGGTSLWLEARTTWRLDRLVFADEEIAIERLRREHAQAQAKVASEVLDLLFAWQRALALEADASRTPEERRAATLEVIEAEARLDVLTGGWFGRWRAAQKTE